MATTAYIVLEQLDHVSLATSAGSTTLWTDGYDGLGRFQYRTTANSHISYWLRQGTGELDLSSVQNFFTPSPSGEAIIYAYSYNGAHQVTSTTRSSYNAARLAHPSVSGSAGWGAANALNQLPGRTAGPSYSYDANGNQVSDGVRTVGYDPDGQGQVLRVDTSAGRATYLYDPLGRRYSKTVGGLTTVYLHDGAGREIGEYDGSGTLLRRLVYDPQAQAPIAVVPASGATLYHHPDGVGTPTVVSSDGGGYDVAETDYLPFGEGTPSATGFGLAGYRYDAESRLYHVGARDYDPLQGRWLQADPIGTRGGINLYAYVTNDPLNLTDPTGLSGQSASGNYSLTQGGLPTGYAQPQLIASVAEMTQPVPVGSAQAQAAQSLTYEPTSNSGSSVSPDAGFIDVAKKSIPYRCVNCGAPTGGAYYPYCIDCYNKSRDENGGVTPIPPVIDPLKQQDE